MTAFLIGNVLGQKAGAYLANHLLCKELGRLGMDVTCFAQYVDFGGDAIPDSFEIVQPWMRKGCRWDWPGRCLVWQARQRIKRERPEYVFVSGVLQLARYLLQTEVASQLLVWELTNANQGNKFVDVEASRLLGRARALLSPSHAIDRNIRQTYGYTGPILRFPFWIEDQDLSALRTPISHLRSPISDLPSPNSDLLSPISHLQPPVDFLFLGRRDEEKGLRELVRATAEVAKQFPNVRVLITGQGSEEPFATLARELGVTANVRFQFFPSREETMQVLANARCLVLPSYHEGYPLVLLEAARDGVPVIATTVGSVSEIFGESKAAILVQPRDAASLAAAMRTILSDSPQQHEERRKAGLELFQKLSSTSAVTANLKTLLHQIDALPPLPA